MTFSQTVRPRSYTTTERPSQNSQSSQPGQKLGTAIDPPDTAEDELIASDHANVELNHEHSQPHPEDDEEQAPDERPPVCHCGLESVKLVSHSAANPDRAFFKCSNQQVCGYFQWADKLQHPTSPSAGSKRPAPTHSSQEPPAPDTPQLNCDCGAPTRRLQSKTDKNYDRWFHKCGMNGQCNFFQWEDEPPKLHSPQRKRPAYGAPPMSPPSRMGSSGGTYGQNAYGAPQGQSAYGAPQGQGAYGQPAGNTGFQTYSSDVLGGAGAGSVPGASSGNACFKCGQEGHWSRDCPNQGGSAPGMGNAYGDNNTGGGAHGAPTGGGAGKSGNCFKCGQDGHWSRDCPNQGASAPSAGYGGGYGISGGAYGSQSGAGAAGGGKSGECYKCGQPGHWASSCPNASAGSSRPGGRSGFGASPSKSAYGGGYTAGGGGKAGFGGGGGGKSGNCYKCGGSGHWANACPA